jgi:hypothetical protein
MALAATNMPLLAPDGLWSCPRCGSGPGTVTQLVSGFCLTGNLAGFCKRCEHSYQFSVGAPSTTTSGTNSQGATTLNVASGTAFSAPGAWIVIDSTSTDGGAEVVQQGTAGTSGTIPLAAASALRLTHAAGASVQSGTIVPLGNLT